MVNISTNVINHLLQRIQEYPKNEEIHAILKKCVFSGEVRGGGGGGGAVSKCEQLYVDYVSFSG